MVALLKRSEGHDSIEVKDENQTGLVVEIHHPVGLPKQIS